VTNWRIDQTVAAAKTDLGQGVVQTGRIGAGKFGNDAALNLAVKIGAGQGRGHEKWSWAMG